MMNKEEPYIKMIYTINKGAHYSSPRCLFCLPKTLTVLEKRVKFSKECFYDPTVLGADAKDINKLFGFSYGLTNSDSLRAGWRSIGSTIEIIAYLHVNGSRYQEKNSSGKNVNYTAKIQILPEVEYNVKLEVIGSRFRMTVDSAVIEGAYPHGGMRSGWLMNPYFGGNKTAPQTMTIELV